MAQSKSPVGGVTSAIRRLLSFGSRRLKTTQDARLKTSSQEAHGVLTVVVSRDQAAWLLILAQALLRHLFLSDNGATPSFVPRLAEDDIDVQGRGVCHSGPESRKLVVVPEGKAT